jgi:hypothetical protein
MMIIKPSNVATVERPQQFFYILKWLSARAFIGLAWADLDEDTLTAIESAVNPADKISLLAKAVEVRHYADNPRSAVLVDFFLYNLMFCEENGFSRLKKSAFFSIMKEVFAHGFEGPAPVPPGESLEFFKRSVLAHSVEAPAEGRAGVFSLPEVKLMVTFVGKTFYRNYSAYRLVFTTRQLLAKATRHLCVETPPLPPPLDQADSTND